MPVRFDPILGDLLLVDPTIQEATTTLEKVQDIIKGLNGARSINLNFYEDTVEAVWHNLIGDIKLTEIAVHNIAAAYISDGVSITRMNIITALKNGPVNLTYGTTITFEIQKSSTGNAALTIAFY